MSRKLNVAALQLGPIERHHGRAETVARLTALLHEAKGRGVEFAVFPEMALTTFFPRWNIEDEAELDSYFEDEMPSPLTRPIFETASRLGIGFYLGYCERVREGNRIRRYNSAVLVDPQRGIVGRYRKIHVPGNAVYDPSLPFQHMERAYFAPGDLGYGVWRMQGAAIGMAICNDRRWSETYRVMGLKGAEIVALGFNSPSQLPGLEEQNHLRAFHHYVCMQAGAYENGTWVIAAAKCGFEGGVNMLGQSCVIAPSGEIVALSSTLEDEVVSARIDLDLAQAYKRFFDFASSRRPECYGPITAQKGASEPV